VRRVDRADACSADFADDAARGLDAIEPSVTGGVFVAASRATLSGAPGSRTVLSASAAAAGNEALSVLATTVPSAEVSAFAGDKADCADDGFDRTRPVSWGALLRTTHMVPTITTSAAAPTPLQIRGPIGARSGFVPHHRHSPNASG
jgi:hypothetical protein